MNVNCRPTIKMSSDTATTINPTTSPAATSMPQNTSGNALFRRQAIPGKGNGLVAIQDIKRGTRIMDEYAVIIGEPDKEIIYAKYCQLEQGAKDEFLQLHHVQKNNFKDNDLKSIVLDIFNTNCWYYPGGAAVYLQQSLLNHSCTPNTEVYMYGTMGRQSVQVLRDISSGEELTTSYLEHVLIPAYKRDLSTWGFVCQCDACHSNSSDRARSKIHNLLNSINNWKREPCLMSIGREEEEALADAIKLGEMLVDEGLVGIELATA